MPPEKHALLSASSASRWLKCTAAPRFEEHLPERTSEYAEEGRLAHSICELKTLKKFTVMTSRTYTTRLNKLKKDPLYSEEMDKTSDLYIEHLIEQAMLYDSTPTVVAEVQVDFGEYVPEGFGTCDNVMIGGDTLSITDYKHGKGVPVSAVGNPQMRLYALGALKRYAPVFGDAIKQVRMSIDQHRLDSYTTDTITVEELLAWGESIKPIAQKAFSGLGEFVPGDHCRFCRGKAQCRARANTNTALEDFKDCVPAASVPPDAMVPQEFSHIGPHGNEVHPLLSDAEIGDLLIRGKELVAWYKDLEEYATKALLDGKPIEGWKLVAGRSIRTFTDQDAAIQAAIAAGYDEALLYDRKPKTLSEMEKLMGKAEFAEKIGGYVTILPHGSLPSRWMMRKRATPWAVSASTLAAVWQSSVTRRSARAAHSTQTPPSSLPSTPGTTTQTSILTGWRTCPSPTSARFSSYSWRTRGAMREPSVR